MKISVSLVAHAKHQLRKLRQEDYESEASLGYTVSILREKKIFKDILKLEEPKGRFQKTL